MQKQVYAGFKRRQSGGPRATVEVFYKQRLELQWDQYKLLDDLFDRLFIDRLQLKINECVVRMIISDGGSPQSGGYKC